VADVDGLSPGKHGFHVHEFGDCSGDGSATGSHFNPTNSKHGGPDSRERHVGDLGNLVADETGYAHYERVDKIISLEGENSILGRSIVIHADPDDYTTQPTGASGTKIACGVIEPIEKKPVPLEQ
jgi:Cu-Zn family superoxide dismutase